MSKCLELDLEKNAGKIFYIKPSSKKQYNEKAWMTTLELNNKWAARALSIDFQEISGLFKKVGYEERTFAPFQEWKDFHQEDQSIYIFDPNEGGLVKGIIQLARDCNVDIKDKRVIPYHSTNMDTEQQQIFLIKKVKEYVKVINNIF